MAVRKNSRLKRLSAFLILILFVVILAITAVIFDRKFFPRNVSTSQKIITTEESVVIGVVEKVSPSVVTVSALTPKRQVVQFSPFGGLRRGITGGDERDIGSGFIVSSDGLIVTNKHVVSDSSLTYKVVTSDGETYTVGEISRDPNNDMAIIKVDLPVGKSLNPVMLGDSSDLKVGQLAIAIGTALGEFRSTVTTGVISGLGRGIDAGDAFRGYVERLDNVIQTDAAINPGNSGGPLLNSAGEVIGVNVAVASGAQNIGFAIPINSVKDSFDQFKATGKFPSKAYLGIQYQMLDKQVALLNNVPEGAYITDVIEGSPAEDQIQIGDIIFKIDGKSVADEGDLAEIISSKKTGDKISLEIWRNGDILNIQVTLSEFDQD
jgi:serine protease Do